MLSKQALANSFIIVYWYFKLTSNVIKTLKFTKRIHVRHLLVFRVFSSYRHMVQIALFSKQKINKTKRNSTFIWKYTKWGIRRITAITVAKTFKRKTDILFVIIQLYCTLISSFQRLFASEFWYVLEKWIRLFFESKMKIPWPNANI